MGDTRTDRAGTVAPTEPKVRIRLAASTSELRAIEELVGAIWHASKDHPLMGAEILRAFVDSGNYVAGAWVGAQLVGASVGFFGDEGGRRILHSHITGVAPALQGAGVGFALKQHQRQWALDRSVSWITWTFDPLVRRNAWFNLMKLGGEVAAYHPNHYGRMLDGVNGSDETDRCLVRWRLGADAGVARRTASTPQAPGSDGSAMVALREGAEGGPDVQLDTRELAEARSVACWIPPDILPMRADDPPLARAWRLGLRSSLGVAIQSGLVATGITKDGWYVLERPDRGDDGSRTRVGR